MTSICPHCGTTKAIKVCPDCGLRFCQRCGASIEEALPHKNCPTKEAKT